MSNFFARTLLAALISLPLTTMAGAPFATWPASAPCNTTLQACIDSQPSGGHIVITTATPIDESLLINKPFSLMAAPLTDVQFAPGRNITFSFTSPALASSANLAGLSLTNGRINVNVSRSGAVTTYVRIEDCDFTSTSASLAAGIDVATTGSGILDYEINRNRLHVAAPSLFDSAIRVASNGGTADGHITFNEIESVGESQGWGILLDAVGSTNMVGRVGQNRVRGNFSRGAIEASEGLFSSMPSTLSVNFVSNVISGNASGFGGGLHAVINDGTIVWQLANNTVVSSTRAMSALRWNTSTGGGSISGQVANNVFAHNRGGPSINPTFHAGLTHTKNLYWNNTGSQSFPAGVGTVTINPFIESFDAPRLRADSPAINMADSARYNIAAIGFADVDADGLRRRKSGAIDIGAYEFGDSLQLHLATAGNTGGHQTTIDSPGIGNAAAKLQATPHFTSTEISYNQPYGVYGSTQWTLFSQNIAPINVGTSFNVFNPVPGDGVFAHVSSASNVSGWATEIDHPLLNDRPNSFVLATQNWTAGGALTYNPHPIGVFYFAFGGPGRWHVINADQPVGQDMPINLGFNIYTQDQSPNAFRAMASVENTLGQAMFLDHPLLNGQPCAQINVSRNWNALKTAHLDVYFHSARQRWAIYDYAGTIAPGNAYFVLVDPRQIDQCDDPLMSDGFER